MQPPKISPPVSKSPVSSSESAALVTPFTVRASTGRNSSGARPAVTTAAPPKTASVPPGRAASPGSLAAGGAQASIEFDDTDNEVLSSADLLRIKHELFGIFSYKASQNAALSWPVAGESGLFAESDLKGSLLRGFEEKVLPHLVENCGKVPETTSSKTFNELLNHTSAVSAWEARAEGEKFFSGSKEPTVCDANNEANRLIIVNDLFSKLENVEQNKEYIHKREKISNLFVAKITSDFYTNARWVGNDNYAKILIFKSLCFNKVSQMGEGDAVETAKKAEEKNKIERYFAAQVSQRKEQGFSDRWGFLKKSNDCLKAIEAVKGKNLSVDRCWHEKTIFFTHKQRFAALQSVIDFRSACKLDWNVGVALLSGTVDRKVRDYVDKRSMENRAVPCASLELPDKIVADFNGILRYAVNQVAAALVLLANNALQDLQKSGAAVKLLFCADRIDEAKISFSEFIDTLKNSARLDGELSGEEGRLAFDEIIGNSRSYHACCSLAAQFLREMAALLQPGTLHESGKDLVDKMTMEDEIDLDLDLEDRDFSKTGPVIDGKFIDRVNELQKMTDLEFCDFESMSLGYQRKEKLRNSGKYYDRIIRSIDKKISTMSESDVQPDLKNARDVCVQKKIAVQALLASPFCNLPSSGNINQWIEQKIARFSMPIHAPRLNYKGFLWSQRKMKNVHHYLVEYQVTIENNTKEAQVVGQVNKLFGREFCINLIHCHLELESQIDSLADAPLEGIVSAHVKPRPSQMLTKRRHGERAVSIPVPFEWCREGWKSALKSVEK